MESQRFDRLTRSLASGASRRRLLKGLAGGVAAGVGGLLRRHASSAQEKVFICHNTSSETNPQVLIHVSVNAIPAHEAHGDLIDVDVLTDPFNCGDCGVVCDDGDACTQNLCVNGECDFSQPTVCDDNNACTEDSCDPATGCVFTPIVCDDEIDCTVDTCDPAMGCVFTPDDSLCDDGVACTVDVCDPAAGGCVNTPDDSVCDDDDVCTNDRCDPVEGCVHTPVECGIDETCCPGTGCTNTASDPNNCGVCGRECAEGEECCEGICISGGECAGICNQPIVCEISFQACGPTELGCICGSTTEGNFGCGAPQCTELACTNSAECVTAFGPGAFCEPGDTSCCPGQVCAAPCGSTAGTSSTAISTSAAVGPTRTSRGG